MKDWFATLLAVVVGWGLGILSHFILDSTVRKRAKENLCLGIATELNALRAELAIDAFVIATHLADISSDLAKRVLATLEPYGHQPEVTEVVRDARKFLELGPEQFRAYLRSLTPPNVWLSLRRLGLPFLDSHLSTLDALDAESQRTVLDIRRRVELLNQRVDDMERCFERSYEPVAQEKDKAVLSANIDLQYRQFRELAIQTADLIGEMTGQLRSSARTRAENDRHRAPNRGDGEAD
jgi:hypothetical protein